MQKIKDTDKELRSNSNKRERVGEMKRRRRDYCVIFVGLLLLCLIRECAASVDIAVGVILDLNSSLGFTALNCTNIALQHFYPTTEEEDEDSSYRTKLQLHFRHSGNDILSAASAARDLIENEKVHAIVGPQKSEQARFIVELGYRYDVPVIWFSPSGPSLLPPRSRFFINSNSSRSHCLQFKAIAAIIEAYNWQSVIPIYEDPEFGDDLIPCLTYALQDMDTRVPYISAISQNFKDENITQELKNIKGKRTYVFIAHMTVDLWSRLVEQAQNEGMMGKGYAWILTQGLSSVVDPQAIDKKAEGYMDGALGVRPVWVLSNSTKPKLASLEETLWNKYDKSLSLYGLWAYDTITALADAVENSNQTGENLLTAIQNIEIQGLSGNFNLRQGQLEPSEVVVYNVKGPREIKIAYWSPVRGFHNHSGANVSAAEFKLRDPTWPGNTEERPPKLKIGVPKTHFPEFVDVITTEKGTNYTGLAVDVFRKVVDVLSFNLSYEFVPLNNTDGELNALSYDDDHLCDITKNVDVDVIIGDITILKSRTSCVDFTMPYLDSSVSMVLKVMSDEKSGWILFKPFDLPLWLILGGILVAATVIVFIFERKRQDDADSKFNDFLRNPFLIYMSDVANLRSGTSKWVVIVVMFLLTLVLQVYTANLTSFLNERTMAKTPPWRDVQEIKRSGKVVGYQRDSWVRDLLINQIRLEEGKLRELGSREEYKKALTDGPKKGGVDAIFDETPYLILFRSNCSSCKITGPIYKAGGFAFAFRKKSTLVSNFSAAILNVTQNVRMFRDMRKNISLPTSVDESELKSDVKTRGLTIDDFGGLFTIVLIVLILFLCFSVLKVSSLAVWLHNKFVSFLSPSGGVILIKR